MRQLLNLLLRYNCETDLIYTETRFNQSKTPTLQFVSYNSETTRKIRYKIEIISLLTPLF